MARLQGSARSLAKLGSSNWRTAPINALIDITTQLMRASRYSADKTAVGNGATQIQNENKLANRISSDSVKTNKLDNWPRKTSSFCKKGQSAPCYNWCTLK